MGKHSIEQSEPARQGGGRHVAVLSRRAFVTATGSLLVVAGGVVTASVGFDHTTADAAQSGTAKPTGTAGALVTAAAATVGRPLANSPWQIYFGNRLTEWNAGWVEWLLKGVHGAPKTNNVVALYSWAQRHGRIDSTPAPGALMFSFASPAVAPLRVAVVERVTKGVAQTIEGGSPANLDPAHQFVRRFSAPTAKTVRFAHLTA
ncbi:MAG: hypothetical protein ACTHJL_07675 [Amnibacterium sp.]